MNLAVGLLTILFAAVSFLKYKPKTGEGRGLCALTAGMGLLAAYAGGGNPLFQAVQLFLVLVVACCCLLQLRREAKLRARRARIRAAVKRAQAHGKPTAPLGKSRCA